MDLYARGTVDDAARFRAAWKPLIDAQFNAVRAEGRDEPLPAYAFDALMEMADLASATPEHDAEPTRTATKTQPRPTPARYLAIIRLDYEALVRGAVKREETCEIRGLGPIPVRIARDLLGDAILKLVITKGVDMVPPDDPRHPKYKPPQRT